MNDLRFLPIDGDLSPEDKEVMVHGMLAYHASHGHERKTSLFSIALKDGSNTLLGCVIVSFLWNGMEILTLWVDESVRGQWYGRRLMEMAEAEGRKRGASIAYTNTFTWQAPGFYTKLGYTLYGKLDNFPPGNSLSYFSKPLNKTG